MVSVPTDFAQPSIAVEFGLRSRCLSEASLGDAEFREKRREPEGQAVSVGTLTISPTQARTPDLSRTTANPNGEPQKRMPQQTQNPNNVKTC